jgi:hypothetical protein
MRMFENYTASCLNDHQNLISYDVATLSFFVGHKLQLENVQEELINGTSFNSSMNSVTSLSSRKKSCLRQTQSLFPRPIADPIRKTVKSAACHNNFKIHIGVELSTSWRVTYPRLNFHFNCDLHRYDGDMKSNSVSEFTVRLTKGSRVAIVFTDSRRIKCLPSRNLYEKSLQLPKMDNFSL